MIRAGDLLDELREACRFRAVAALQFRWDGSFLTLVDDRWAMPEKPVRLGLKQTNPLDGRIGCQSASDFDRFARRARLPLTRSIH